MMFLLPHAVERMAQRVLELSDKTSSRRSTPGGAEDLFHCTGDLVQTLSDGNLRFVGRKDRWAKVRGHRVELDETESALGSHEQVAEAAVYPADAFPRTSTGKIDRLELGKREQLLRGAV